MHKKYDLIIFGIKILGLFSEFKETIGKLNLLDIKHNILIIDLSKKIGNMLNFHNAVPHAFKCVFSLPKYNLIK